MSRQDSHAPSYYDYEFGPSPTSSVGDSPLMCLSRNSETGEGCDEEGFMREAVKPLIMPCNIEDMLKDKDVLALYPLFAKFLKEEDPRWYEPAPIGGAVIRVLNKKEAKDPEETERVKIDIRYEMLDLMYRYKKAERDIRIKKREVEQLKESNKKLREASVKMYVKAEQEEEYISNSLLKKIQKLKSDKDYLVKKYQHDEEALTSDLMKRVAEIHQGRIETEKIVADKQAEINRLQQLCGKTEKQYNDEMYRIRMEKVDHESALEQEQELLINTMGKRMSQANEEKRKMQQTLEKAYLAGYLDYNESVEAALRASAASKYGTASSPASQPSPGNSSSSVYHMLTNQQEEKLNSYGTLFVENQKLRGYFNRAHMLIAQHKKRENELESIIVKMRDSVKLYETEINAKMSKMVHDMDDAVEAADVSADESPSTQKKKAVRRLSPFSSQDNDFDINDGDVSDVSML